MINILLMSLSLSIAILYTQEPVVQVIAMAVFIFTNLKEMAHMADYVVHEHMEEE
jgi:hypothetical protein